MPQKASSSTPFGCQSGNGRLAIASPSDAEPREFMLKPSLPTVRGVSTTSIPQHDPARKGLLGRLEHGLETGVRRR